MIRISPPAVDLRIAPGYGVTRDGQPLSYNRAPAPDLAPWIARVYVAKIDVPAEHTLSCGYFTDTGCLRIQLSGQWRVDSRFGTREFGRSALFFGPQTRLTPVSVTGGFVSIGVAIRPSACSLLLGGRVRDVVDRIETTDAVSLPPDLVLAQLETDVPPEDLLRAVEDMLRLRIEQIGGAEPEPASARFEDIAFTAPTMEVAQAAREIGVDRRRLERMVDRDFGMSPKQVLKRARALDMASHLRGVADDDEAEALTLRYYDESHLIHDFVELFGMSPRQFSAKPQPLLTMTLEARQARRLERMNRIAPGARRPWQ